MVQFGIIADDLSGASDTAISFSKRGYKTHVLNYPEGFSKLVNEVDVVALSTNSREVTSREASYSTKEACLYLKKLQVKQIYKKIDSTWRGNIGVECETIMEEMGQSLALICSAFPQMGRTIIDGQLLINGIPVHETPLAHDPACPMNESFLPTILRRQTSVPVIHIHREIVVQGPEKLAQSLREISRQGKAFVLLDAEEKQDLKHIALLNQHNLPPFFFCGSAGLIKAIHEVEMEPLNNHIPPTIVIIGSAHPKNLELVNGLRKKIKIPEILLNPLDLNNKKINEISFKLAKEALKERKDVLIFINQALKPNAVEINQVGEGLKNFIQALLGGEKISGVFVTGGATALDFLRAFGGVGIELMEEVESGVPYGQILGGEFEGIGIITKAGEFGSTDLLYKAYNYLKSKYTIEVFQKYASKTDNCHYNG